MSGNKIKENVQEEEQPVKKAKKSSRPGRNFIRFMNLFGVFDRSQVVHAMPFILFVTVLIIGYIANSYYAERLIRDIDKTGIEVKEKHAEYISSKFDWMYNSRQSHVARALDPVDIHENLQPPVSIVVLDQDKGDGKKKVSTEKDKQH